MIQNYIVALIGLVTAGYILSRVIRAFIPRHNDIPHKCTGCSSCPASSGIKYRELRRTGHCK